MDSNFHKFVNETTAPITIYSDFLHGSMKDYTLNSIKGRASALGDFDRCQQFCVRPAYNRLIGLVSPAISIPILYGYHEMGQPSAFCFGKLQPPFSFRY